MSTELDQIKKEMQELVSKDIAANSPEAIAWMERAANLVRKDSLQPGQVWAHDGSKLVKAWTN